MATCGSIETNFPQRIARGKPTAPIITSWDSPLVVHAVRSKNTPIEIDATPQLWYTGAAPGGNIRPAYRRWHRSFLKGQERPLPRAYAQHFREASCSDPIVPAQYLTYKTRWGAFNWADKVIPGKEYVANRHRFGIHCESDSLPLPTIVNYTATRDNGVNYHPTRQFTDACKRVLRGDHVPWTESSLNRLVPELQELKAEKYRNYAAENYWLNYRHKYLWQDSY
ncbi:tektin bundle-interacting protein 1 [Latimeria chalumnae]|uniref:Uncharacterized protein n=1 Tax=Latimeria chalumnae TaxID=7897 RepID=M3XLM8_LATCH|nr:PREDICTED: uncharacterized protein C19orf71 homolog [Latimeria chalumnae]|eukprot:XP_014345998.1 PREDICTED: uncharacterized protein C19orf71 homolog [Latimeria chalumnae]